jgi:HEAT repeat protein
MSRDETDMQELLTQLTHNDEAVRYDAAQALGKRGDAAAVNGLVDILNDSSPKVKYAALSSLVKIGSPVAATPTIAALLDDLESRLWKLLVLDIGMRLRNGLFDMVEPGNQEAADMLVEALDDARLTEYQRALVIRLIGRTEDQRMVATFIDMLMIATETLQGASAEALGYIRDERAVTPLIDVLADADSAVREIAINALGRIGDERAGEALLPLLDSGDEWTRRAAATALSDLGDRRAVRKLLRMQREDDSQVVREAAGKALTRLIMQGEDKPSTDD